MSNLYHRGDSIFLYVQFKDEQNKPITVSNPLVRIIHENKDGEIVEDLEWFELSQLSPNEYFANYSLDYEADYAAYEVVYVAEYADKVARVVEDFHVIPHSTVYENVVKLYGYVNHLRLGHPLASSTVKISLTDSTEVVSQNYTREDGYWEAYVYPGEYNFEFSKYGFNSQSIIAQVGLEHNEIQFNNIALEAESLINNGSGIHLVTDKLIVREGTPLNGLNIKAYNVFNPTLLIAEDNTDDEGEYRLFLDPGTYLVKIEGTSLNDEYSLTFRVRVDDEGKSIFENLTSNVAVPMDVQDIGQGSGEKTITDKVLDANGNPLVDVRVSAFLKIKPNDVVAEDYTNPGGRWELFLDPGDYIFEFYHPDFNAITEERIIT